MYVGYHNIKSILIIIIILVFWACYEKITYCTITVMRTFHIGSIVMHMLCNNTHDIHCTCKIIFFFGTIIAGGIGSSVMHIIYVQMGEYMQFQLPIKSACITVYVHTVHVQFVPRSLYRWCMCICTYFPCVCVCVCVCACVFYMERSLRLASSRVQVWQA